MKNQGKRCFFCDAAASDCGEFIRIEDTHAKVTACADCVLFMIAGDKPYLRVGANGKLTITRIEMANALLNGDKIRNERNRRKAQRHALQGKF